MTSRLVRCAVVALAGGLFAATSSRAAQWDERAYAALDGLGLVGAGGHSLEEFVDLDSIVPRVYLLARFVMECAGRQGAAA